MIIYDLSCDNEHRFEGWFRSADDFEQQIEKRLVSCPQCDSDRVRRIPSAIAIGGKHETEAAEVQSSSASNTQGSKTASTAAVMPADAQVMGLYRQLVQAIVSSSEDVGSAFAEEARKIHYNEAPERAIRGQATMDECEALKEEGIDVFSLPKLKDEH